jgi:hypothetical protein
MTVRSPVRALLVAAALGPVTAFAAACGEEERTGLLTASRAEQLKDGVSDVNEAVADGSCTRVGEELGGLRFQLGQLPQDTDPQLRQRLEEGIAHLEDIAPTECEAQQPETTPETTETVPETTTEDVPTEPEVTEPETTEPAPGTEEPGGEEGEGGGGGGEELPGNGNGPPGGVPPGQEDDVGGAEGPDE